MEEPHWADTPQAALFKITLLMWNPEQLQDI
jgi:hypothetical protein